MSATYQTTQDKQIKENAVEHLRALRVDEDVQHLQEAVTRFGERTGRLPASMASKCAYPMTFPSPPRGCLRGINRLQNFTRCRLIPPGSLLARLRSLIMTQNEH